MEPLFSVVIPTYTRVDALVRVLEGYQTQQPADLPFEVVVVDDGSTDHTLATLAKWRSQRFRFRFTSQANSGPAMARNRGLDLATGQLVLFTGDDIEPTPDLLYRHWLAHGVRDNPGAAILGLTRWPPDAEVSSTMRHIDGPGAQQFSYHYLSDGNEYDFRHFYTSNVSARRDLLAREPEGFSCDFPAAAFEDAEYAYRLSQHGLRIFYCAAAVAYHNHPYGVRSFFRRQVRCGEMAHLLFRKRPELKKWTGLGELEWRRLELLGAPAERRIRVHQVAADLDDLVRRALSLAAFYDTPVRPETDLLLHPLFQYAYHQGLANSFFGPTAARPVLADEYLDLLPGAVDCFEKSLRENGHPCPAVDCAAINARKSC